MLLAEIQGTDQSQEKILAGIYGKKITCTCPLTVEAVDGDFLRKELFN